MSTWKSCNVTLNTGVDGVLFAGDIVTGSVFIYYDKTRILEYVIVKITGESRAFWTRPSPTMPFIKIFSDKNRVLEIRKNMFQDLCGKKVIPAVTYEAPLHFYLPPDLPQSFSSSIAEITYSIKVIAKARNRIKSTKIIPLKVHRKLDLNNFDEYTIPTTVNIEKRFWNSNVVSFQIKTYKCVGAGQFLPIKFYIDNKKRVKISKINIVLKQIRQYNVSSGYAIEEKNIVKTAHNEFASVQNVLHLKLLIPPNLISSTIETTDDLIEIKYVLRIEVMFSYHLSVYEELPIVVSTAPVMHQFLNE